MQRAISRTASTPRRRAPRELRDDSDLPAIVRAAADGDTLAWQTLVQRFTNMIMAVARSCGLGDADVAEVHQVTWLRMVENIDRIQHPERIGAWLVTTSKRESIRVARSRQRISLDHEALLQYPDVSAKPLDDGPITEEQSVALHRAYALLPPRCKRLLDLITFDDPPSYKEISRLLAMPIGSIGPTRGRCLEHLRRILEDLGTTV